MPISKKAYVLTADGKAVEDDGHQTGVVLCGAGCGVTDEVAKKYKLSTDADPSDGLSATPVSAVLADSAAQTAAQTAPAS
jgi:hypothetical protein